MKIRSVALVSALLAAAMAQPFEEPPQPQGLHKPHAATAAGDPGDKGPPEIPKKPAAVVLAEVKPGPQDPEKPGSQRPNLREVR